MFEQISAAFNICQSMHTNRRVVIYERGSASFNPIGHECALRHFENTIDPNVIR